MFGSQRCDCGPQLRESVERITEAGGYLLYLRQEGRGIGLYRKLDAYLLQDDGLDTYEANLALGCEADARDYSAAAQMLRALGESQVALLSNNPDKAAQLDRTRRHRRRAGADEACTCHRRTAATSPPRPASATTRWTGCSEQLVVSARVRSRIAEPRAYPA